MFRYYGLKKLTAHRDVKNNINFVKKYLDMEMIQEPQFIKDNQGQNIFAIISIDKYNSFVEYEKKIEELEDLQDIEDYKKIKSGFSEYEPFDEVVKRIKNQSNG